MSSDIIRCWGQTVLAPMIPDCVALRVPAILKNMHMDTVPENVLCERNPGRDDEFVVRKIGEEYIAVPVGKAALEFNGLLALNEQGAWLWKQMAAGADGEQLLQGMLEEYDVDRETAESDIKEFVNNLREKGILEQEEAE